MALGLLGGRPTPNRLAPIFQGGDTTPMMPAHLCQDFWPDPCPVDAHTQAKPKRKQAIRKGTLERLHAALAAAEAATSTGPAGRRCGVADVHKAAFRLYMDTWVTFPLRTAIAEIEGTSND